MGVAPGRALAAAETVRLASVEVAKGRRQPPALLRPLLLLAGRKKIALIFKNSNFREGVHDKISNLAPTERPDVMAVTDSVLYVPSAVVHLRLENAASES